MPRIVLISAFEKPDRKRLAETRISAQPRPSTVATTSARREDLDGDQRAVREQRQVLGKVLRGEHAARLRGAAAPAYLRPQLARILSVVPSAFILRSDALILSSIALSPFFTPMPTLPGSTGL